MSSGIYLEKIIHKPGDHKLENSFFDSLEIGSSAEWVSDRTGIESRHSILDPLDIQKLGRKEITIQELKKQNKVKSLQQMASELIQPLDPLLQDIDLVICGTSIPDYEIPANASPIAQILGIKATCFDVNSACSSFVTNLQVASSLLETKKYTRAGIFNLERYTTRLDFSDKRSCILFGDGGVVSFLSAKKPKNLKSLKLLDTTLFSDPSGFEHVKIPCSEHFWQNGAAVQKFAISKTCESSLHMMKKHNLTTNNISYFVGHQANLRMLDSAATKLGFSTEQHLHNVEMFGNQGACGAPSVLSNNWEKFRAGDLILVTVVGSGLTWGSALFQCVE